MQKIHSLQSIRTSINSEVPKEATRENVLSGGSGTGSRKVPDLDSSSRVPQSLQMQLEATEPLSRTMLGRRKSSPSSSPSLQPRALVFDHNRELLEDNITQPQDVLGQGLSRVQSNRLSVSRGNLLSSSAGHSPIIRPVGTQSIAREKLEKELAEKIVEPTGPLPALPSLRMKDIHAEIASEVSVSSDMYSVPMLSPSADTTSHLVAPPESHIVPESLSFVTSAVSSSLTESYMRQQLSICLSKSNSVCRKYDQVATECMFLKLTSTNAYYYELTSFAEQRETQWTHTAYLTEALGLVELDGPSSGAPPKAWEMNVDPTNTFIEEVIELEVPHTSSLRKCNKCSGIGKAPCLTCRGLGHLICPRCRSNGRSGRHEAGYETDPDNDDNDKRCFRCLGSTRVQCTKCYGPGSGVCAQCEGTGKLRAFQKMTAIWKNHLTAFVSGGGTLPPEQVRLASGIHVFAQIGTNIAPPQNFPDPAVMQGAQRLITEHLTARPLERIIAQKQRVSMVPITEAHCLWRNHQFRFWVFGTEHLTYVSECPEVGCGCEIM